MALLEAVWTPAVARVREEVADMQAIADAEGAGLKIAPWDYRYYAEKVRKAKYDLDQNAVKPYLQLDKLREGVFWVAGELFGLRFSLVQGVPVYHPDVTVYEVKDASGRHVGLFYFDPWARPAKQSGAWMNAYRDQERFDGETTTIVSNNLNFVKGAPGEPVLIGWTDAETLFHEFGHALHGLLSSVSYPSLVGHVGRARLRRAALPDPRALALDSRGALALRPAPPDRAAPPGRARGEDRAVLDLQPGLRHRRVPVERPRRHEAPPRPDTPIDPDAFERDTLKALGMPSEIVMRHRTPQFGHIFAGDGYSAGYYSYLWADTLTADAWEAFTEAGGPYDQAVARRFRERVLSVGNTVEPADAYRAFRGRDAGISALMRDRGFPVPAAPKTD